MSLKSIESIKDALKKIGSVEESTKEEGLKMLQIVLSEKDRHLTELGYDQVVFKELMKTVQYDSGQSLRLSLEILGTHYFDQKKFWDELAETIIYRVARTSDVETCTICVEKISSLVEKFDDSIAKHSKQLLKLSDLNDITSVNPIFVQILIKMREKLPKRREIPQEIS